MYMYINRVTESEIIAKSLLRKCQYFKTAVLYMLFAAVKAHGYYREVYIING